MRALILLSILFATSLAAEPARAQMYKWVDERGVTNYSSELPADPKATKKLAQVENKISVYTPDAAFMDAVKALQLQRKKALSEPEPERQQVYVIGARSQSAYEQCLASGQPGCDELNNTYYPAYFPGLAVRRGRPVQPTRFLAPAPASMPRAIVAHAPARRMAATR